MPESNPESVSGSDLDGGEREWYRRWCCPSGLWRNNVSAGRAYGRGEHGKCVTYTLQSKDHLSAVSITLRVRLGVGKGIADVGDCHRLTIRVIKKADDVLEDLAPIRQVLELAMDVLDRHTASSLSRMTLRMSSYVAAEMRLTPPRRAMRLGGVKHQQRTHGSTRRDETKNANWTTRL